MKSLQTQFNLIKEGKANKETFVKNAKAQFPDIPNYYGFNETVNELKYRNILVGDLINESNNQNTSPDWFKLFNESINETKAEEKKPTKEVVDMETRGFDYKDKKNINNVYGEQFLKGFYTEMQDPKNEEKTVEELKSIVAKNLAKDQLHYVKDGQFGVKGVGYTTEHPGLGTPKEAKGKYKSSGYGNLNENKSKIDKLLNIINTKKAGPEYKKALMDLIAMAEEKSGKTINTKKEALLALDYVEPTINEIGMFNDPIGYKKSEPDPKDEIFTKEYKGNGLYDIFKNGVKITSIKGEGNANAFMNDELRKLKESKKENTLADIEDQLLDANIGDMAYGGGYGPFKKVSRNTWTNVNTNSLSNSESLASFIGRFNDFKIETPKRKPDLFRENKIRKAIRLIIKEELNK